MKWLICVYLCFFVLACHTSPTASPAAAPQNHSYQAVPGSYQPESSIPERSSPSTYSPRSYGSESDYEDGEYTAEVQYYNPRIGTYATYTLNVEVEDGELVRIDWPNGGWLDDSHFSPVDISDGHASFVSDRGYSYEVDITDDAPDTYSNAEDDEDNYSADEDNEDDEGYSSDDEEEEDEE